MCHLGILYTSTNNELRYTWQNNALWHHENSRYLVEGLYRHLKEISIKKTTVKKAWHTTYKLKELHYELVAHPSCSADLAPVIIFSLLYSKSDVILHLKRLFGRYPSFTLTNLWRIVDHYNKFGKCSHIFFIQKTFVFNYKKFSAV